jgi:hypothetical protein
LFERKSQKLFAQNKRYKNIGQLKIDLSNKAKRILLTTIVIFVIMFSFLAFLKERRIRSQGRFAIATITETSRGKSGTNVKAIFYYNYKSYKINFLPSLSFDNSIGRKFFIKFLPKDPMSYNYYDIDVPICIINDTIQIWNKIPICNE